MVDRLSPEKRSWNMSRIRSGNTEPERKVRSILHRLGYRFRLHRRDLPGSPDIVLPRHKVAIFVHGCFWHQHRGCKKSRKPTSNTDYWDRKLTENVIRDRRNISELKKLGWRVLVIWQCETRNLGSLADKLALLVQAS